MKREKQRQLWLTEYFGDQPFTVAPASEDASFRSYYRISTDQNSWILMDAPIEHEDCQPFIHVQKILHSSGLHVPAIHAQDLTQGFILLSDFGSQLLLDVLNEDTVDDLYQASIDQIIKMQCIEAKVLVPPYDAALLMQELSLFSDWFIGEHLGYTLSEQQQNTLRTVYQLLTDNATQQPQAMVHRDYHSRNLMLTEENPPGIIDFQDAVYGPFTYDLASLLKDCYISWDDETIQQHCQYFLSKFNQTQAAPVSMEQFERWFDLMATQRHLKAIGIFCRLNYRDGKAGYLNDIPRTLNYVLQTTEKYDFLSDFQQLIKTVQPSIKRTQ